MAWDEYSRRVDAEWHHLLEARPGERAIQAFLEQHPSLVPGSHFAFGRLSSGHGPFPGALITQPGLSAIGQRIPDFLWISRDSAYLNPIFIEIEDSEKLFLTRDGNQHHDLTYALGQLRSWREWFNDSVNQQVFLKRFQVPKLLAERRWAPLWVLIYGRQGNDPRIPKLRADLRRRNEIVIPYEHLKPQRAARDFICVRNEDGRYEAVSIPPTARLHPAHAEEWSLIRGKEVAAAKSTWMTVERRAFFAERLAYWDEWARRGAGKRWNSGDWE